MSTFFLVSTALGALATILTSLVQTGRLRPWAQGVLALVVSAILGFVQAAQAGDLDGVDWHSAKAVLGAAVVVFAASQAVFHSIWKGTGAAAWLEQLGNRAKAVEAQLPPQVEQAVELLATKLLERLTQQLPRPPSAAAVNGRPDATAG